MSFLKLRNRLAALNGELTAYKILTATQVKALNGTPIVLVNKAVGHIIVFLGAELSKPANSTVYDGIAAGEDFAFQYGDAPATQVGSCEATGFMDQATLQTRWCNAYAAKVADGVSDIVPVANSNLTIKMLVGNIATGLANLHVRVHYRMLKVP